MILSSGGLQLVTVEITIGGIRTSHMLTPYVDLKDENSPRIVVLNRNKVWPTIEQQYYGIKREDVEFILKRCKNCTLNRPTR
jgi:hypothetical protein